MTTRDEVDEIISHLPTHAEHEAVSGHLNAQAAEIARLRRDCGELYQVIGVLANGRPVLKRRNHE